MRIPSARQRHGAVPDAVHTESEERHRARAQAQHRSRHQRQSGRRSESRRGDPRAHRRVAREDHPLAHRHGAGERVSPALPGELPRARRQGRRIRADQRRAAATRHHLQRLRDSRQGSGRAAPVPRHAERFGAAGAAPALRRRKAQAEGVVVQLRPNELEGQLSRSLLPAYAIHGDEPLLAMEAGDAVRAAARRAGYTEREVLEPGRGFDWSEFTHATGSLSLFATKRIVELRLPTGKPGPQGGAAIAQYLERPSTDLLLLLTLPRLDRSGQGSPWFSTLARAGAIVEIWPMDRSRLPAWIAERLARQKQSASREVLEFLAERVEGNLLAAHQELQKLTLLAPQGELSMDTVQQAVASVARYDPNGAAEALLAGDTARYVRIIEGLHGEGEQPTFVLYVLTSVLFVLQGAVKGSPVDPLF